MLLQRDFCGLSPSWLRYAPITSISLTVSSGTSFCTSFCNSCMRRERLAFLKVRQAWPPMRWTSECFPSRVRPAGGEPQGRVSDYETNRSHRLSKSKRRSSR